MKNKKVCILTSVHKPYDIRIFHKQARTLAKKYDVTLIVQHDKTETRDNITILPLPSPKNRFQRMFSLTWKIYRIAKQQKADIYHFHDPELLPVGALLRLTTRKPVIYDVHENYSQSLLGRRWVPALFKKPLSFLTKLAEQFFALFMSAIIPVTDSIAAKFNPKKTIQVRNYPLLELDKDSTQVIKDPRRLIYVGGIRRSRGVGELVKALGYLPKDVRLTILGRYEEPDFEPELQNFPGYDQVDFGGWVPLTEVWNQMQSAAAGFVLFHPEPNHEDALPNKLFEYMSAGIPVVASDFPLWRQIIQTAQCGIQTDPMNPEGIARAIQQIIDDPQQAQEMGKRGKLAVQTKFNWEAESQKLLDLYEKLTQSEVNQ